MRIKNTENIYKHSPWKFLARCASVFVFFCVVMACRSGYAQVREEIEERKPASIELETLRREEIDAKKGEGEKKKYKLLSNIELGGSYETNPRLSAVRKGDSAGHMKYSVIFKNPIAKGLLFNASYNFDGTGYSEANDLTNLLNHTRMSLDKSFNKYLTLGGGYDFSSFYYPKETSSDFYFHKGFLYLKQNINKNVFQQVTWEEGFKDYFHASAYANSLTTFQNEDRRDYRHGAEHSIGIHMSEELFFMFRIKFTINDSNAFYQDYHDYKSWEYSPSFNYKISDKYSVNGSLKLTDKEYKNRLIGAQTETRDDLIFSGSTGVRYNMSSNSTVSLGYQYNNNDSNDPALEYTGSKVSAAWQYKF